MVANCAPKQSLSKRLFVAIKFVLFLFADFWLPKACHFTSQKLAHCKSPLKPLSPPLSFLSPSLSHPRIEFLTVESSLDVRSDPWLSGVLQAIHFLG